MNIERDAMSRVECSVSFDPFDIANREKHRRTHTNCKNADNTRQIINYTFGLKRSLLKSAIS